jgi:hypothetical protein
MFKCKISYATTHLLQWCEILNPQKGQGVLFHEGGGLVQQNFTMGKNFKFFFEKEGKFSTMDGRKHLKPLTQIGSCGVLWMPSTTNVFPLLGLDYQGGYGVVHKVGIKRFDHIPNMGEDTLDG